MCANLLVLFIVGSFLFVSNQVLSYSLYDRTCCDEYCLADDLNPDYNFSSKTPYEFVYGRDPKDDLVPDCHPVQIWSFNRHGTRYPNSKNLQTMMEILPQIQKEIIINYEITRSYPIHGRLCEKDLNNLKKWVWMKDVTVEQNEWLTNQGKIALHNLAQRTRDRFPDLFANLPYSEQNYVFKYTEVERIEESYKNYVRGFFESNEPADINGTIVNINNPLLGFFTPCETFQNVVTNVINDPNSEPNKFAKTHLFEKLIADVSRKLGFDTKLPYSKIDSMYKMCVYEKAWYLDEISPWCAVFTKAQMNILEYYEDLFYYYQSGYGNNLSKSLGCNAAKDLLKYFKAFTETPTEQHPKLIASFTHSPSIRVLFTALDMFQDPYSLRADNYDQAKTRQWRSTEICPFAANLASVLYYCPNTNDYKVKFLLNEKTVDYPKFNTPWNWEELYEKLKSVTAHCNFDFCGVEDLKSLAEY